MVIAGAWFLIAAVINAAAQDLAMLYIGRIFLGFGVGFANQSVSFFFSCALEGVKTPSCQLTVYML